MLTLSQVVKRLYQEHCGNDTCGYLLFGGDDAAIVDRVFDAYSKYVLAGGPVVYLPFHKVHGKPTGHHNCSAAIIVHLSGTLDNIAVNVTKNRFGNTFTMYCNPLLEEKAVTTLHPDSSSYADCFRILREAKKDGVIYGWDYRNSDSSGCPIVAVFVGGLASGMTFPDRDGTKGDIGILREAAAYCLDLRKKRQPKRIGQMSEQDCMDEIEASDYGIDIATVANSTIPTIALYKNLTPYERNVTGLSLQFTETRFDFLKKCVAWIREQK